MMLYVLQRRVLARADAKKVIGRRIAAVLVVATVLIGVTVAVAPPAHAASGGGCNNGGGGHYSVCISLSGSSTRYVVADFYTNWFDCSRSHARIEIRNVTNLGEFSKWSDFYDLRNPGRHGPLKEQVFPAMPQAKGYAFNRVHFFSTCSGSLVFHHYADSPRQYYP
jgi:hypothetical protein